MSRWPARFAPLTISFALVLVGLGCGEDEKETTAPVSGDLREVYDLQVLPPIPYPPDNEPRQERISLGRMLFFDPILSGEKDVACGTCHHPDFAFGDRRQFGAGVSGVGLGPDRLLGVSSITGDPIITAPRNTPTVFNTAFNIDEAGRMSHEGIMFWDGRAQSLEEQATKPIASRVEMRGDAYSEEVAVDSVLGRLRAIPEYVARFAEAFPVEAQEVRDGTRESVVGEDTYAKAVGAYERELVTRNSPYDRFVLGDDDALTPAQKDGLEIFFGKARCSECHSGPLFADFRFIVQGVPQEGPGKDVIPGDDTGREEATGFISDRYAFRTVTLRNVEITPPYMHDGCFETLEQVVDFYNAGANPRHDVIEAEMIHPSLQEPLGLTATEKMHLVEFMKALTDAGTALDPFLLAVPNRVPSGLPPVFGMISP